MFQILIYYLCENWNPVSPQKVTPSFPANPSKRWGPVKPPPSHLIFFWASTPAPTAERGVAHYGTSLHAMKLYRNVLRILLGTLDIGVLFRVKIF